MPPLPDKQIQGEFTKSLNTILDFNYVKPKHPNGQKRESGQKAVCLVATFTFFTIIVCNIFFLLEKGLDCTFNLVRKTSILDNSVMFLFYLVTQI